MATNQEETQNENEVSNNLLVSLSTIGGLGITLMVVVGAVGVSQAEPNTQLLGLGFTVGMFMLIGACIAWVAIVRPFENFDDINVAQYHGHHHDDHDDEN